MRDAITPRAISHMIAPFTISCDLLMKFGTVGEHVMNLQ